MTGGLAGCVATTISTSASLQFKVRLVEGDEGRGTGGGGGSSSQAVGCTRTKCSAHDFTRAA